MKQTLLLAFSFVCSVLPSAAQPNNVEIKLTLSEKIAEVPQMIYLYGGGQENQCYLYDSVATQPNKYEYLLYGYVPYEANLQLIFSRKGPTKLQLLAHPDEQMEVPINDEDDLVGGARYKHLGDAHWANDLQATFWDRLYACATRRVNMTDSMAIIGLSEQERASLRARYDTNESENNEYIRKMALTAPSPYVSMSAANLLRGSVPKDVYAATKDSVKRRFPDYYPLHVERWPMMTEQSRRNYQFIRTISAKRIAIHNDLHKSDSLRIYDTPELTLRDSLGNSRPLSDYRGKFVLLEMWASWCRPCIEAMPNIILAQQLFDGLFTCCAISIDKSEEAWKRAISNHHLEALNHYKAIDGNGELFDDMRKLVVKGTIPQNYLLNRDGRVIAINIYGEELISKLGRLIAK